MVSFSTIFSSCAICRFATSNLSLDGISCTMLTYNLYNAFVGILGSVKSNVSISFMTFCIVSSSTNNISGVYDKVSTSLVVICTVSMTGAPSLTSVSFSFYCCSALILNCSSEFFTSCTCSKIEALCFSTFSHTFDSLSLI
jgi:hypothetical protein